MQIRRNIREAANRETTEIPRARRTRGATETQPLLNCPERVRSCRIIRNGALQ